MVVPTGWILFDWVLTVGVLWASFWAVEAPLPLSVIMMGFGVGPLRLAGVLRAGRARHHGRRDDDGVRQHLEGRHAREAFVAVLIFRLTYQVVPLVVSLFLFTALVRQALRQVAGRLRAVDTSKAPSICVAAMVEAEVAHAPESGARPVPAASPGSAVGRRARRDRVLLTRDTDRARCSGDRRRGRRSSIQLEQVGWRSISIVSLTALSMGMVLALQLGNFLERFGAKMFVSRIVGVSLVREMAPILTALMLGGRVGAGFTAELGTMAVTEQIDAAARSARARSGSSSRRGSSRCWSCCRS